VAALPVPVILSINVSPDRWALLSDYETPLVIFMPQYKSSCDLYPDMISMTSYVIGVEPK
jgi:hypothetical protein